MREASALRTAAVVSAVLTLAGCAAPAQTSGGERAVAVYREQLRQTAARAGRTGGAAPASGNGQSVSAPAPASLTADEAVAMARSRSARLAELSARVDEAAARVAAAGALPNPQLRVSQLRLDQILSGEPRERTALRVSLSRPGEIDAKVAEARAEEAEARAALLAEELDLEADVRWLFDDVVLLEKQIAAADAVAAASKAIADRVKLHLESSLATALEEAAAAISAVNAEQDRAELAADRVVARARLLARIGLDPASPVGLAGDPLEGWPPPPLPDERAVVEAALRTRPEIAIAASRIDASGARASFERAKRWPWFSFLEVGHQVGPGIPAGWGWTFQAGVDLPIFDTNRDGVAAADAAQNAAKKALEADVQRVALEVGARLAAARAAEALVTDMKRRSLPVTERASSAVQRALAGNDVDVVRALTVDERRVVLEARLLAAIRRYRVAVAELRRAAGGKLPVGPAAGPRDTAPRAAGAPVDPAPGAR